MAKLLRSVPDLEPALLFEMELLDDNSKAGAGGWPRGGRRGVGGGGRRGDAQGPGHAMGARHYLEPDWLRPMRSRRRPSKAWVLISFFLFNCSQISPPLFFGDENFVTRAGCFLFLASDPSWISSNSIESRARDEARDVW